MLVAFAAFAAGCNPAIGDKCQLSTDCSLRGDRQCDVAQPGGYCTILNCGANSCPSGEASCVLFRAAVPGCDYDDRSVSRTARSFCMKICDKDSDCRDGYVCRSPSQIPATPNAELDYPWHGVILDDDQSTEVCIPAPRGSQKDAPVDAGDGGNSSNLPEAGVCRPTGPVFDGGEFTVIDGGAPEPVPTPDAGTDAGADAGVDASPVDAGADATLPPDAGVADAGVADAGVVDATTAD